ncbi:MAG: isopentenyl phosphate kinase [Anaerolineae bacterium]
MGELVFLKLGGSLITDKRRAETPHQATIVRAAQEIAAALKARPDLRLVLGHGSGSFGHFAAAKYGVHQGNLQNWHGYAETAAAAQRLNRLVVDAMLAEGVPAVALQPSASALCEGGVLRQMATEPVEVLLSHGLVPTVYGDVALDVAQGCTIVSTEQILVFLARRLRPQRIILVGEVAGVYSGDPKRTSIVRLIPEIHAGNFAEVERLTTASFGVDVTGGMLTKVRDLFALVMEQPETTVRIITGQRNGLIERALTDPELAEGTLLRR